MDNSAMDPANVGTAATIGGLVLANIVGIITGYVSLKVGLAVLSEKVGRLSRDVDNLGDMIRQNKENKK